MTDARSTRQTIVQLLSNMSGGKEIRSYLQRFSAVDQTRFAVIKVGGSVIRDELNNVAQALAFLHRVGLTPIVLHGGGPQLDAELVSRGVRTPKVDGLRVTDERVLDAARDVFVGANIKLVEALRDQGVHAEGLIAGVIEAEIIDKVKYGLVGEPAAIRRGLIESVVKAGAIPVLTCLGLAPGGQIVNVNGDSATRAIVSALKPIKIIFLTQTGGILDGAGAPIHSINLASDYEALVNAPWLHSGMLLKLQEIKRLLDVAPLSASVSVTTPGGLIRELFTHGGDGTLVRLGEKIISFSEKSEASPRDLIKLIESAFQKKLIAGWWENIDFHEGHVTQHHRAAAILSKLDDFIYLDKFAVLDDARGEGLARTVWRRMTKNNPLIFWRSRTENAFNSFYDSVSTGAVKSGAWTVYWAGEADLSDLARRVNRIAEAPTSFEGDDD